MSYAARVRTESYWHSRRAVNRRALTPRRMKSVVVRTLLSLSSLSSSPAIRAWPYKRGDFAGAHVPEHAGVGKKGRGIAFKIYPCERKRGSRHRSPSAPCTTMSRYIFIGFTALFKARRDHIPCRFCPIAPPFPDIYICDARLIVLYGCKRKCYPLQCACGDLGNYVILL